MAIPPDEVIWYMGNTESTIADITFYAYTKEDFTLGYAFQQPQSLNKHNIIPTGAFSEAKSVPIPETANRQKSVSVILTGLTLSYYLGCCTHEEMKM